MNKQNQTKLNAKNLNTVDMFLNISTDIICIIDIKGYFKYVNNTFLELTNHLESELLTKTFFDFLDPKETLSIVRLHTKVEYFQVNLVNSFYIS